MDAHLAPITASLDQIHALHRRGQAAARRPPFFTNAVLNPQHLDILELIRDADQLEASLFAYPGGRPDDAGNAGPSSADPEALHPQLRAVRMPTPLKKARSAAAAPGAPGSDEPAHDARKLLAAAEKLIENYHNAPRARKHIRTLMRREDEVRRHIARYESTIANVHRSLEARTSGAPAGKRPEPRSAGKRVPATPKRAEDAELRQLRDAIQRERMEIVALESMMSELEAHAAHEAPPPASTPPARRASAGPSAADTETPTDAPAAQAPRQTLGASRGATPGPAGASRCATPGPASATPKRPPGGTLAAATPSKATPGRPEPSPRSAGKRSLRQAYTASPRPSPRPGAQHHQRPSESPRPPQTVASGTPTKAPTQGQTSSPTTPAASEELEQITAKLWSTFGENLRYVAPGRESADFGETFVLLRALEHGGARVVGADKPQGSAAASGPSGAANPTSALSALVVIMAHVLLLLLRARAPHSMQLADVKVQTGRWWNAAGQKNFRSAMVAAKQQNELLARLGFDTAELGQGGEQLATRAVYSLVAKKLLRIHRAGGAPNVRFA